MSKVKWDVINVEYVRQLIRASSSVIANYIEASDDLGPADEKMKIKIARRAVSSTNPYLFRPRVGKERKELIQEALEIRKILSTTLKRLE